jgi:hypothetical protein
MGRSVSQAAKALAEMPALAFVPSRVGPASSGRNEFASETASRLNNSKALALVSGHEALQRGDHPEEVSCVLFHFPR